LRVSLFLPIITDSGEKRLRDLKIPLKAPKIKAVFDKRIKKEYYIHVGTFTSATRRGDIYDYSRVLFRAVEKTAKGPESGCFCFSHSRRRLRPFSPALSRSFMRTEHLGRLGTHRFKTTKEDTVMIATYHKTELKKDLLLSGLVAQKEAYELARKPDCLTWWEECSALAIMVATTWSMQGNLSLAELCEMLALMPAYMHRLARPVTEVLGATEDPHWLAIRYEMGKAGMSRHSPLPSVPKS
jgi:hypothetical protein